MDIKLIALDLDGTLLDADHATVPPRNLAALRAAADRGVKLAIASGRTWCLTEDVAAQLEVADYAVLSNGAEALDLHTGRQIFQTPIPFEQWHAAVRLLRKRSIPFELYSGGNSYMERGLLESAMVNLSPVFAKVFLSHITLVEDAETALNGKVVVKFNILHVKDAVRAEVLAEIAEAGEFACSSSTASNLELTAPRADKGAALERLCAELSIPAESVMAFGDADNDLGMLSWAGWSFAMDNGTAGAKAAAKRRTAPHWEAGVGQAVERYVLGAG